MWWMITIQDLSEDNARNFILNFALILAVVAISAVIGLIIYAIISYNLKPKA